MALQDHVSAVVEKVDFQNGLKESAGKRTGLLRFMDNQTMAQLPPTEPDMEGQEERLVQLAHMVPMVICSRHLP